MSKGTVIIVAASLLAMVNIVSLKYLGPFSLFVIGASVPFAEKLLELINTLP